MGKWCLGSSCSKITNQASAIEVPGADFDVVNVSDFDGEFLGAGVPSAFAAFSLLSFAWSRLQDVASTSDLMT